MKALNVYYRDQLVGILREDESGRFSFTYHEDWSVESGRFPISVSLPLEQREHRGDKPHFFFSNLLPEGLLRQAVARRLGISEDNDFELLRAIGGECAGALSIVQGDLSESRDSYRELPAEELDRMMRNQSVLPFITGDDGVRLSLAGAQDKLPVYIDNDSFMLPLGHAPSTHILKFSGRVFKHLAANEVFTTMLAHACGLPAVSVRLHSTGTGNMSVVERYDRKIISDGTVERYHQEDCCQALGISPKRKYEAEGGPAFADAYRVITKISSSPLEDGLALIRWAAFTAAVCNADGHAKNLSVVFDDSGAARLAPFYDLVCTRAYNRLSRRLAMAVGGEDDPDLIRQDQWERMLDGIGVGKRLLKTTIIETIEKVKESLKEVAGDFEEKYQDKAPVLQMVLPKINKQTARLLREIAK